MPLSPQLFILWPVLLQRDLYLCLPSPLLGLHQPDQQGPELGCSQLSGAIALLNLYVATETDTAGLRDRYLWVILLINLKWSNAISAFMCIRVSGSSPQNLLSLQTEGEKGEAREIIGANKDQKNNPLVPYFLENACHGEEEENGQASPRLWISCVPTCWAHLTLFGEASSQKKDKLSALQPRSVSSRSFLSSLFQDNFPPSSHALDKGFAGHLSASQASWRISDSLSQWLTQAQPSASLARGLVGAGQTLGLGPWLVVTVHYVPFEHQMAPWRGSPEAHCCRWHRGFEAS